jgi:hypothetical protein
MATFKLTFLLFLLSITTTATAQNPCNLSGQEINSTCQPVEGQCPKGYGAIQVTLDKMVCVRPMAEPATVAVKTSPDAPTAAPQIALNERLTMKVARKPKDEKRGFLASLKAQFNGKYNKLTALEMATALTLTGTNQRATNRNDGFESNRFLRGDRGKLSSAKYWGSSLVYLTATGIIENWCAPCARVFRYLYIGVRAYFTIDDWRESNR